MNLSSHIIRIVSFAIGGIICIIYAQQEAPPVPLPADLVEIHGRLNSEGDWTDGRCSFTMEEVPAHLYLACERMNSRAQQSFRWGMRPGTGITAYIHRNDSSQLLAAAAWVEVRGLIADRDTLLDKDFELKDAPRRAESNRSAYFWTGVVAIAGATSYALILWYLRRKPKR